eukprot:1938286-Rhodomonas_salina.1
MGKRNALPTSGCTCHTRGLLNGLTETWEPMTEEDLWLFRVWPHSCLLHSTKRQMSLSQSFHQ